MRKLLVPACLMAFACSSEKGLGPVPPGTFADITAGFRHTCALFADTTIAFCWGDNAVGQGGNGMMSTIDSNPMAVSGFRAFTQIAGGQGHTCGVVHGGVAYCWGVSNDGALGSDTTTRSAVPIPVAGALSFKQISAGFNSTCALTQAGTAYCWGANDFGQLGRDTTATQTPVPVETSLTFTQIAVGQYYACAIATSGGAYCWGANTYGNLGTTDTTTHAGPRLVAGGLQFRAIAVASYHTCGITTSAAAYCWGAGQFGLLGNGSTSDHPTPAQVLGGHQYTTITLGANHSCGLTVDLFLFCWGLDDNAQLAGTTSETCILGPAVTAPCSTSPISSATGHVFRAVSAGAFHTCGIEVNGGAFCWGRNDRGQVGNGRTGANVVEVTRVPDPPPLPPAF